MATTTQKINVIIEATYKGFQNAGQQIQNIKRAYESSGKGISGVGGAIKSTGQNIMSARNSMGSTSVALGALGTAGIIAGAGIQIVGAGFKLMKNVIGGVVNGIRKFYQSLKGFRPEWLSVLFISQQLNKVFQSILDPILQLIGYTEILEVLLQILEWFTELPDEAKTVISYIVLFGAAITLVMQYVSQFVLLISSMGAGLGTIVVLLTPLIAALGVAALLISQFGDNMDKAVSSVNNFINNMADKLLTWIKKFSDFFTENRDKIVEIGNTIIDALLDGIINVLNALEPVVIELIDTLKEMFDTNRDKIGEIIHTIIGWMVDFFVTFLPEVIWLGATIISSLLDGIIAHKEEIKTSVQEIIQTIKDLFTEYGPEVIELGGDILGYIVDGIISMLDDPIVQQAIEDMIDKLGELIEELAPYLGELIIAGIKGMSEYFKNSVAELFSFGAEAGSYALTGKGTDTWTDLLKGMASIKYGNGLFATGGNVPTTGLYTLHKGETVTPSNESVSGETNMTVVYNVTVSDKREFEAMLERNNTQLLNKVRRTL